MPQSIHLERKSDPSKASYDQICWHPMKLKKARNPRRHNVLQPIKHLLYCGSFALRSFKMIHGIAMKDILHRILHFLMMNNKCHPWKALRMDLGRTKLQSNKPKTSDHNTLVALHPRIRWSTVSSSAKHIGQTLTNILFRWRKLSRVGIPPRKASQPKAITLGGAFIFHRLYKGLPEKGALETSKKTEDTKNIPSWETFNSSIFFPFFEMETLLIIF